MKNQNEVVDLLAGRNAPRNRYVRAEVLKLILETGDKDAEKTTTRNIVELLRSYTDSAVDAAKMVKALLIALPESYDEVFGQVCWVLGLIIATRSDGATDVGGGHTDMRPLMAGFPIGMIEAAVWLSDDGQCHAPMRKQFANNLGTYLRDRLEGAHTLALEADLSGRLSNVSTKFVKNFNYLSVLKAVNDSEIAQRRFERGLPKEDMACRILSELCLRATIQLPLQDQIRLLVERKKKDPEPVEA